MGCAVCRIDVQTCKHMWRSTRLNRFLLPAVSVLMQGIPQQGKASIDYLPPFPSSYHKINSTYIEAGEKIKLV